MSRDKDLEARFRNQGLETIGATELLYLVLRPGVSGDKAWEQASSLLRERNRFFREWKRGNWTFFAESGLSRRQCCSLFAGLELCRRSSYKRLPLSGSLRSSRQIFTYFRPLVSHLEKECFWSILLDGRNRVSRIARISEGTLTSSLVHPREVFRPAVLEAAASLIFVHNHPTGEPDPSPEDISITRRLAEAGKVLGIVVLDHVIIGNYRHFSFADEGLLKSFSESDRSRKGR